MVGFKQGSDMIRFPFLKRSLYVEKRLGWNQSGRRDTGSETVVLRQEMVAVGVGTVEGEWTGWDMSGGGTDRVRGGDLGQGNQGSSWGFELSL